MKPLRVDAGDLSLRADRIEALAGQLPAVTAPPETAASWQASAAAAAAARVAANSSAAALAARVRATSAKMRAAAATYADTDADAAAKLRGPTGPVLV